MKKNKRLLLLAQKAVLASFEKDKLNEKKVRSFTKAFSALPRYQAILSLSEFLKGIKRELSKRTLLVEATIPLSKPEVLKIKKSFHSKFSILNSIFILNPSLLGGIKVKIGDNVFDGSIKEKINEVKEIIVRG